MLCIPSLGLFQALGDEGPGCEGRSVHCGIAQVGSHLSMLCLGNDAHEIAKGLGALQSIDQHIDHVGAGIAGLEIDWLRNACKAV